MSSRRQRSIPLGGRYRQVSLYQNKIDVISELHTLLLFMFAKKVRHFLYFNRNVKFCYNITEVGTTRIITNGFLYYYWQFKSWIHPSSVDRSYHVLLLAGANCWTNCRLFGDLRRIALKWRYCNGCLTSLPFVCLGIQFNICVCYDHRKRIAHYDTTIIFFNYNSGCSILSRTHVQETLTHWVRVTHICVQYKTVSWPSYIEHENPIPGKDGLYIATGPWLQTSKHRIIPLKDFCKEGLNMLQCKWHWFHIDVILHVT